MSMIEPLPTLELYCGIGGFAAAAEGFPLRIEAAYDQSDAAIATYRINFPDHPASAINLEHCDCERLSCAEGGFWWLSPPCQPYCARGHKQDLDDPRSSSFRHLLRLLPDCRLPNHIGVENVPGFRHSEARNQLLTCLNRLGFRFRELDLCPTAFGIPSRRQRYYLLASRRPLHPLRQPHQVGRPLAAYLDVDRPGTGLELDRQELKRFGDGLRLLDPEDSRAYTTCFTSGYRKALMHSGSYLLSETGARRFSPTEIARLLSFPDHFHFPDHLSLSKQWQLVGNSLSVVVVRHLLSGFDMAS